MNINFSIFLILSIIFCLFGLGDFKYRRVFDFFALICMFVFMSSARVSVLARADLTNYENTYNAISLGLAQDYSDPLFYFIQKVAVKIGLSFYEYKAIYMGITLILIYILARHFTEYASFVLLGYIIQRMLNDMDVIRYAMAGIFILYAVHELISEHKGMYIRFFILIALATAFHSSMIVFISLIFIKVPRSVWKRFQYAIPVLFIILIMLVRNHEVMSLVMQTVGNIVNAGERFSGYAVARSRFGWFPVLLIWIVNTIVTLYFHKQILLQKDTYLGLTRWNLCNLKVRRIKKYIDVEKVSIIIKNVTLLSFMYMPLCVLTFHFMRIHLLLGLLNILYFSMLYTYFKKNRKIRLKLVLSMVTLAFSWYLYLSRVYEPGFRDYIKVTYFNGKWFWLD